MQEDQPPRSDELDQKDTATGNRILAQAKNLLARGEVEKSLELVKSYWLQNPDDPEAITLMSEIMQESGQSDLSKRLNNLSSSLPSTTPSAAPSATPPVIHSSAPDSISFLPADTGQPMPGNKELFEAGYSLIEARQHELAAMLLNRVSKLVPGEPTVNYELGFALMSMKRFEQAIPYLEESLEAGIDFDTLLNLLVCYMLIRDIEKAREILQKIGQMNLNAEQKQEYTHRQIVLKRLESLSSKNKLNARDWLYILYGSILLRISTRQDTPREDPASIGFTLAVLKGVLEGLSIELPETIEFYAQQSRPLAQALAEFFEIPMSAYKGPQRQEQTLLTMTWASDIVGPHKSFVTKQPNRHLFSYGLSWDEPLPVVPDIIGCFAYEEPMPWRMSDAAANQSSGLDTISIMSENHYPNQAAQACKNILAFARDLESEPRTIKHVQEALDYYESKRQYLIICNAKAFPKRNEYTAEVLD